MNIKQIFVVFLVGYVILMIISFIVLVLSYSKKEWRLPPSSCPDFWIKKNDGVCYNPRNISYEGNPVSTSDTFVLTCDDAVNDGVTVSGINSIRSRNIIWDGITYGYGSNNPC